MDGHENGSSLSDRRFWSEHSVPVGNSELNLDASAIPDLTGRIHGYSPVFRNSNILPPSLLRYGTLYRVQAPKSEPEPLRVAIKLHFGDMSSWFRESPDFYLAIREMKIRASFQHENILRLLGFTSDPSPPPYNRFTKYGLVSPFIENGTILDYLSNKSSADIQKLVRSGSVLMLF